MTITTLESIAEGAGGPTPKTGDKVVVHYSGWLAMRRDGEPFDSSREKGHAFTFTVGVGKVIPGWDEAVQQMCKGERKRVLISSDDAYGPKGRPPVIPPNADLIFDIELMNINETLVEEGMRVRREEKERIDRFLKLQDEERAAEERGGAGGGGGGHHKSGGGGKKRERSSSGSSDDSSSCSPDSSEEERRRRKRERKERKREKRERRKEKKESSKKGHKEKSSKKHKKHKHRKHSS